MDPWRRLEVARGASKADVRAAWLREARAHHPDHGGDPIKFRSARDAMDAILTNRSTYGSVEQRYAQHWEFRDGRWVVREAPSRFHRPSGPVVEKLYQAFHAYNRVRHLVFLAIGSALVVGAIFDPTRGIIAKRRQQKVVPLSQWSWQQYKRTAWTSKPS